MNNHHCVQTLTIGHMLLGFAVLQECRDDYYTVHSLNALFETIHETCIMKFLREAGFFYPIWCNLWTSTRLETWTIWSDFSNMFSEWKQTLRHIYLCRTANMSWRACVVKQNQPQYEICKWLCPFDFICRKGNRCLIGTFVLSVSWLGKNGTTNACNCN